jgi:phosphomannomutase
MGAKVTAIGDKASLVVAFEEAIGALNTTINRDKDSFTASALALEIYHFYQARNMDLVDILTQEIYPIYGQWFGKTTAYTFDVLNWKPLVESKMNMLKHHHAKTIGN